MKILIVYSSKTGNTQLVAESIAQALDEEAVAFPIAEAPDCHDFDWVIVGFWIDKGKPNAEALRYLKALRHPRTAFFFTLGAEADCEHAEKCREKALTYFNGPPPIGDFRCQGKISPALIGVLKRLPAWFPHGPNPERVARWERAAPHPDADDLKRAAGYFAKLRQKLNFE